MIELSVVIPVMNEEDNIKPLLEAVRSVSEHLANTPTVCRKSYVHDTIFVAFENGTLQRYSAALKLCRTTARREQVLAQVVAASAA